MTVPDVGVDVAVPSIGAEASADMPTVDAEMPSVDLSGKSRVTQRLLLFAQIYIGQHAILNTAR